MISTSGLAVPYPVQNKLNSDARFSPAIEADGSSSLGQYRVQDCVVWQPRQP